MMIKRNFEQSEFLPEPSHSESLLPAKKTSPNTFHPQNPSDQGSFEPENPQRKKISLKDNRGKYQTGGWSSKQNYVYYRFMGDNYSEFLTERDRRRSKVFFRLSKILKKRTPDQCRSHHQKLQLKFKDDMPTIMSEVYKKIQKSMAQEIVNDHYRRHKFQQEKIAELASIKEQNEQFKMVVDEKWFSLFSNSERLKIIIRTENIQTW